MYIDLDPHYSDVYGDPLPRVTMDYGTNELNSAKFVLQKYADIMTKMGCTNVTTIPGNGVADYHMDDYQAHTRGGARMGSNPATSVFNKWCQCWEMNNLFAAGEILNTFGDNTTAGTHVAGMMAYLAADGIKKYLVSPGPLG
jgi:gluconate 2-dehydrogenase alpha chain